MSEGDAQRYFDHAQTLRELLLVLRNNPLLGHGEIKVRFRFLRTDT